MAGSRLFRRSTAAPRRSWIRFDNIECLIEADGGIKLDNVREVHAAGVDVIVSGSGIFGADGPVGMIREMRAACGTAL